MDERIEDALRLRATDRGQAEALRAGDRSFSYDAFWAQSRGFAAELLGRGLGSGDRVAIFLENTPQAAIALHGTWIAGGIAVPVHAGLKQLQVAHILGHSGATHVVTTRRGLAQLPEDASSLTTIEVGPDSDFLEHGEPRPMEQAGGAQPAAILYTSGSTGRPKGILISHANLVAGARIVAKYLELDERDRLLSVLPFSFDYGLNQLLSSVAVGACVVLQRSTFPADIGRTLVEQEITGMAAVPPLWIQLMSERSPLPDLALPSLRYITNSGGVLPVSLIRRFREKWPDLSIYLMYGLSEAFRSTYLPPALVDEHPESMGRAIPECDVLVIDDHGLECAAGEVGELVHRGPTVALGYWQDAEATARVFRPDPTGSGETVVYAGDLVRRDELGLLYFVGRRDQMLKTLGFRVSPDEVEEQLFSSDLIEEVVILGEPDPEAGTVLVAHIVPRNAAEFDERELRAWSRRALPHYMQPARYELHAALPRTSSGKLDRKALAR